MKDYHALLTSVIFLRALLDLDLQVALSIQAQGCTCRGPLHWARYPRVPLGVIPLDLVADFSRRLSFCCGSPECRRRTTPPSVCFLGRRQYIAVTFVILSMLRHGVTKTRAQELHALAPVDDRTLKRWRDWWCRQLPSTPFWRAAAGRLAQPVRPSDLPARLLERFSGDEPRQMTALLEFLSELSTTSCRTGSGFVMVS